MEHIVVSSLNQPMGEPHSGSPVGYYFLFNVLQGIVSFLAGANLHNVFYVINEDLAVANMSGVTS